MQARFFAEPNPSSPRRPLALLLCAIALLAGAAGATAQGENPQDSDLQVLVQAYVQDPAANRDRLVEVISRQGVEGVGGLALVLIGDAYMRAGDLPKARRLFDAALAETEVVDSPEETGWRGFAHLGLGMIDVSQGDMNGAYRSFGQATEPTSPVGPMAMLGAAQAAAALGKEQDALDLLAALDEVEQVPAPVRDASRFARANMLLRKGEYEEAAELFEKLAEEAKGGIATDARYAAARARLASGDVESGRGALESLVGSCPAADDPDPKRTTRRLRELDSRAVLQAWVENYREASFESYAGSTGNGTGGFAVDGCALARVSVTELALREPSPAKVSKPLAEPVREDRIAAVEQAEPAPSAEPAAPPPAAEPGASASPWPWIALAVAVIATGWTLLARARRRPGS